MAASQYPARAVRAKTDEVAAYHHDDSQPGKPLYLLVPGGLIALASLLLIINVAYRTWFEETLSGGTAAGFLALLVPVYVAGVFMFSYGYELYDLPKALRLTLIVVVITVSAVVIIAVLFALLGGKSSSSKSSKSSESSGSLGSSIGDSIGSFVGGSSTVSSGVSTRSYSSQPLGGLGGPIFLNTGGGSVTHEVTHEVVREVPVSPPPPQAITCPFCGRSYVPAENKFACPACGAATPAGLIANDNPAEKEPPHD